MAPHLCTTRVHVCDHVADGRLNGAEAVLPLSIDVVNVPDDGIGGAVIQVHLIAAVENVEGPDETHSYSPRQRSTAAFARAQSYERNMRVFTIGCAAE